MAPVLAILCLKMLSDAIQITYALVLEVIKKDCHVYNILTGTDSFKTLAKRQEDISSLLSCTGFQHVKWFSNGGIVFFCQELTL